MLAPPCPLQRAPKPGCAGAPQLDFDPSPRRKRDCSVSSGLPRKRIHKMEWGYSRAQRDSSPLSKRSADQHPESSGTQDRVGLSTSSLAPVREQLDTILSTSLPFMERPVESDANDSGVGTNIFPTCGVSSSSRLDVPFSS